MYICLCVCKHPKTEDKILTAFKPLLKEFAEKEGITVEKGNFKTGGILKIEIKKELICKIEVFKVISLTDTFAHKLDGGATSFLHLVQIKHRLN